MGAIQNRRASTLRKNKIFFNNMRVHHRYLLQEQVVLEARRKEINRGPSVAHGSIVLPVMYHSVA